eukprot:331116-Pleurochrysis_carterae.AAC.1
MGWGKGTAKRHILTPFLGNLRSTIIREFNPFANRPVLVDAPGWGLRASKRGAKEVALLGCSAQQQQTSKATQGARQADQAAAQQQDIAAQSRGEVAGADKAWKLAAVPQEPPRNLVQPDPGMHDDTDLTSDEDGRYSA